MTSLRPVDENSPHGEDSWPENSQNMTVDMELVGGITGNIYDAEAVPKTALNNLATHLEKKTDRFPALTVITVNGAVEFPWFHRPRPLIRVEDGVLNCEARLSRAREGVEGNSRESGPLRGPVIPICERDDG